MIPFQHGVFATAAGAVAGFEAIATVTATGGETSLTFSSIPQGYASLQIRGIAKDTDTTAAVAYLHIRVNGDSGSNYSMHRLQGDGSTVSATGTGSTSEWTPWGSLVTSATGRSNIFAASIIDIHDYASTTRNKTARMFVGVDLNAATTDARLNVASGAWFSTAAITQISISKDWTAFAAGTTFALYGIKAAA